MEIGVISMLKKGSNPFPEIAKLGLTTVQIQNWKMEAYSEETAAETVRNMRDAGIRLAAFWAGYSGNLIWNSCGGPETLGLVPPELRQKRIGELKKGADFAKLLNAPAVITHCGFIPENPADPLYAGTVDAVAEVASYCRSLGLGFWFETGQETPLTLLRIIEDIGLDNLGVNLDTANLILYGRGNPVDALEVLGRYVRNLHIKDGLFPVSGRVLGKEVPFGEGRADFDRIIRKLYELDFDGDLIIEREISGPEQIADITSAAEKLRVLLDRYAL